MSTYLPYIVSVLCAVIAGFASYAVARKQTKSDMQKIEKQYKLDIEKEREKFEIDKEKMEIEHNYQIELMQKEMENKLGTDLISTMAKEYMRTPAVQSQMRNVGNKNHHK